LADLLGTGCAKAGNVPDIDLQTLINGFKSGEAIKGLQKNVEIMIAQGTGYDKLQNAVVGFHNTVTNFNNTVTNKLNPLIIKRAVENYITNLAYNLLTGCGNQLLTTTIRPEVLSNIAPYIALVSSKIDNTNTSYVDQTGTIVQPANTTLNT
jgi:hypothetical protein